MASSIATTSTMQVRLCPLHREVSPTPSPTKNFTLTFLTTYVLGQRMMNMVKGGAFLFNKKFGVVMNDFTKAKFWAKEGDRADYPSLEFADDGYVGQFDGESIATLKM